LISAQSAQLALAAGSDALVPLAHPLSSDMNVLRPSLLPGLLDALRHNLNHKSNDIALFEMGRVFTRTNSHIGEERRIAVALTGNRSPAFWSGNDRDAKFDLYDLKGVLEQFFEHFGVRGVVFQRRSELSSLYIESATAHSGKQWMGELGQISPLLARKYDLRDPVLMAEFNLELLLARRSTAKSFKALPAFPSIRRDVAMIVPENVTHESVLNAVKQTKPPHLEGVELFDVFRGANVPAGQKSVAYAFTYRNPERTLTDAEANASHDKVVEELKRNLGAIIRE
jgi:phenylalanyl-tRNA synthetase beta chain